MAKLTGSTLMLAAALISGCVNPYPLPIVNVSEEEAISKVNGVRVMNPDWLKGVSALGLDEAKNLQDFRINVTVYHKLYIAQYEGLVNTMNVGDGATVLGGLWGVAGALTGTKAWIYQGAGVAGVSSIYTDHYQIKVQSENYYNAAKALRCMYKVVGEVPDGVELSATGIRSLNIALNDVTSKLLQVQREVVLAQPDLNKLKEALGKEPGVYTAPTALSALADEKRDNEIVSRVQTCATTF